MALAPPPGEAPLPAPNAAALLRRNGTDPAYASRPALRFGERIWTHAEAFGEMTRYAGLFLDRLDPARPPHVAVLLDNTPEYVFCLGGAALAGAAVVGLNHTRRDEHLLADISYTDVQLLVTEPRHQGLLAPVAGALALPGGVLVSERFADGDDPPATLGEPLEAALERWEPGTGDPGLEPDVETLWVLLFTSGTSSAPKAVRCTQRRLLTTGNRMTMVLDVGPDDVGYLAMPLFHSNSLMVGLAPALVAGASVGLARRFSASRFLEDVRRYGATWFNYTGKPLAYLLATPERPDDAREHAPACVWQRGLPARGGGGGAALRRRCRGRVRLDRGRDRPGPLGGGAAWLGGQAPPGDQSGRPRRERAAPRRVRLRGAPRERGGMRGRDGQRRGGGPVRGVLPTTTRRWPARRGNGWYWSGDLGYVDAEGWVYFAGRTSDWLRVDGENFPAAPIEAIVVRHPDVMLASVYGVPDVDAGDQVMAALVWRDGASFDPAAFAAWVDAQSDLSPKWRPRYVRLCKALPTTATNKVLVRTLVHQKFRAERVGGDPVLVRGRGEDTYKVFGPDEQMALHDAFVESGRAQAWDL